MSLHQFVVAALAAKANSGTEVIYSLSLFRESNNTLGVVVGEDANNLSAAVANQTSPTPTHIVLVHEDANGSEPGASSTRIYINGVEVGLSEGPSGFAYVDEVWQLGACVGVNGFAGMLDDVQIYYRVLTLAEVSELFTNPGMLIGIDDGGPIGPGTGDDADRASVSVADDVIAGTDLNDASDYFRPTESDLTADGFSFSFASVVGRSYSIEFAEALSANGWTKHHRCCRCDDVHRCRWRTPRSFGRLLPCRHGVSKVVLTQKLRPKGVEPLFPVPETGVLSITLRAR